MNRLALPALLAAALPALAQAPADPLLKAIDDELARSKALKVFSTASPYYFEYAFEDNTNFTVSASLGALMQQRQTRFRMPRIQVRVGDYAADNTNFLGTDFYSGTRYDVDQFPIDDDYSALRHHLWLATDMAYKQASEAFSQKKAALRNVTVNEQLPDFLHAAPANKLTDARVRPFDESPWAARVRRMSALFADYPAVTLSSVSFEGGRGVQYLVTSEGTRLRLPENSTALRIRATAQAADGMLLRDALVFHSLEADRMPADAELDRGAKEVAANLTALVKAPIGEAYTGPVLFEGRASAQMFAEVLGKNFTLPRRPVSVPGRPVPMLPSELENKIGARVLPDWMDVIDDPTLDQRQGRALFGHYDFDLEGVPAERVSLVEKGVLKGFLLTRQPVKGVDRSNGHARMLGAFGAKAAGISNLFVNATGGAPTAQLRQKLIDVCRERNKPYGIVIRKMDYPSSAPFNEIHRALTRSAAGGRPVSAPTLVYRVYLDGHEELVRGLRLRGFNTRSLKDIVAASDDTFQLDLYDNVAPFAAMGGASWVSETSVVAPAVLIDDVELEPAQDDLPKVPLVPPPALTASADEKAGSVR